ncbi:MAG: glycosyltransferase, partial [Spirulinaceae cyanobacterium RM2_2_10]|nr:glycosyltransferase [Spirulinaceae cyanobacterium RM2_2_10]
RHLPADKIHVIPMASYLDLFRPAPLPKRQPGEPLRLLYFGILAAWQGVDLAIRAAALAASELPVELAVIGRATRSQQLALARLADKLGIGDRVHYHQPLPQPELVERIHAADATVVPLALNDRNLVQGCCPLKLLEGMAAGRPAIASDLPVTRAIGRHEQELLLTKPGLAPPLADAILRLGTESALAQQLATQAQQHIARHYTWAKAGTKLAQVYTALGVPSAEISPNIGSVIKMVLL